MITVAENKSRKRDEQGRAAPIMLPLASTGIGLFVVTILLLYRLPRLASYAGIGGTWYSVPIGHAARVAGTVVLAGCLVLTVLIRRRVRQGEFMRARLWLTSLFVLTLVALGLGVDECRTYVASGLTPSRYETVVFNHTDLSYLHAVRQQLKQHDAGANPTLAIPKAQQAVAQDVSLALVDHLQQDMVTWTEMQVALWDSDIKQRWADLMLFGYQIRPRPDGQGPAEAKYRAELASLKRARKLLPVLRDYCRARLAKMGQPPADSTKRTDLSIDALERQLRELAATATDPQQRMIDWAMAPNADARLIGDQMHLAQQRLKQLDGRLQFAADYLDPLFSEPHPRGIAARHPELGLPIQLPDVRSTARTLMLVRWTLLLWLAFGVAVLASSAWRWWRVPNRHHDLGDVTFWQVLAGIGILSFLLLG